MRTEIPITVLGPDGRPLAGAAVTVRTRPGGATATVYAAETGGATAPNPLTTNTQGQVTGWVDRGAYEATISAAGLTTYVEPFDSAPAADRAVDDAWLNYGALVPIGGGIEWFAAGEPAGGAWLVADGRAVSRATYAALYAALGGAQSPWGQGDGVGTFNLPDTRGRTGVGPDVGVGTGAAGRLLNSGVTPHPNTRGDVGGADRVTLTARQSGIRGHGHPGSTVAISDPGHRHALVLRGNQGPGGSWLGSGTTLTQVVGTWPDFDNPLTVTGITATTAIAAVADAVALDAHDSMPSYYVAPKLIRVL